MASSESIDTVSRSTVMWRSYFVIPNGDTLIARVWEVEVAVDDGVAVDGEVADGPLLVEDEQAGLAGTFDGLRLGRRFSSSVDERTACTASKRVL